MILDRELLFAGGGALVLHAAAIAAFAAIEVSRTSVTTAPVRSPIAVVLVSSSDNEFVVPPPAEVQAEPILASILRSTRGPTRGSSQERTAPLNTLARAILPVVWNAVELPTEPVTVPPSVVSLIPAPILAPAPRKDEAPVSAFVPGPAPVPVSVPESAPESATAPATVSAPAPSTAPATTPVPRTAPALIDNRPPRYPRSARQRGHEGTVDLRIHVLASGEVAAVKIASSSGHGSLDRAAVRAAEMWRFRPATEAGRVIARWIEIPVEFNLRDDRRGRRG